MVPKAVRPGRRVPAYRPLRSQFLLTSVGFFRDKARTAKQGRHPFGICGGDRVRETGKQVFEVVPRHGQS